MFLARTEAQCVCVCVSLEKEASVLPENTKAAVARLVSSAVTVLQGEMLLEYSQSLGVQPRNQRVARLRKIDADWRNPRSHRAGIDST